MIGPENWWGVLRWVTTAANRSRKVMLQPMKRIVAIVTASIALLVLPSFALANSSSISQGYGSQADQTLNLTKSRDSTAAAGTAASGTLPFTGIDDGLLVTGGMVLLGAGLVVRRLTS